MGLRESFLGGVLVDLQEEDGEDFNTQLLGRPGLFFSILSPSVISMLLYKLLFPV